MEGGGGFVGHPSLSLCQRGAGWGGWRGGSFPVTIAPGLRCETWWAARAAQWKATTTYSSSSWSETAMLEKERSWTACRMALLNPHTLTVAVSHSCLSWFGTCWFSLTHLSWWAPRVVSCLLITKVLNILAAAFDREEYTRRVFKNTLKITRETFTWKWVRQSWMYVHCCWVRGQYNFWFSWRHSLKTRQ